MSGKNPCYRLTDFYDACNEGKKVFAMRQAKDGAEIDFNIKTKKYLLEFIANDGLEDLEFINSVPWENNPHPENKILVDAYKFRSGGILGYLAFFYNPLTQRWTIKSFKQNEETNPALKEAFKKALQGKQKGGHNE